MFMTIAAVMSVSAVFADSSSVTSKKYVDDFMTGYQDKVQGLGANKLMIYDNSDDGIGTKDIATSLGSNTSADSVPTVGAVKDGLDDKQDTITGTAGYVMTGTGYNGSVGEKPIYGTNAQYNSALVTAETVNSAVTNAVNGSLIRVDENGNQNNSGTLWEIQPDLIALNICSNYAPATGTGVQNGTPTPTNPILPTFYQDGDMILRRVGDYADSYDANTNKITRRVGVKVLDGTEAFNYSGTYGPALYITSGAGSWGADKTVAPICTHYTGVVLGDNAVPNFTCGFNASGHMYFRQNDFTSSSATSFKQWLAAQYAAGSPVVIYYILATPVTEDMPPRCQ